MKINKAFDQYLHWAAFKGRSKSHRDQVKVAGESLVEYFGNIDIRKLGVGEYARWKEWLKHGRCENTCRGYVLAIRVVLKFLKTNNIKCLDYNAVPIPTRQPHTPDHITAEQVSLMIDKSDSLRTKFIISLLYSSGIRVSELISLNRGQIQNREFTVIGKGKKERLCFIDDRTEHLMSDYLATRTDRSDALIVTHLNNTRPHKSTIELIIRNAVKRAGLTDRHITPHTFRHSFATNYLQNNGNIRYLQEMLGHASMETTQMYTHVVNNELKRQYQMYHTV